MHKSLQEVETEWHAMRALTLDLLDACSDQELTYAPPNIGPVWKQFRHIGGIHETYLNAIKQGRIVFDGSGQSYSGGASRGELRDYFQAIAERHIHALEQADPRLMIDWFGDQVSLQTHLIRLISHETLHHGQFILQWRMRGVPMPASWQAWGV